ncbi:MAG TPA: zf-HC2 domain-containing protein [Thermoanaerobaculia bacterium]|jgi:hypothetical protein|nr:zf-HC2 domain-containing protein [Thermoanaerobaculia bacterium]
MNGSIPTHPAESPEFLSRLQDGELSAAEAASFEEHRKTCARCRENADSYTRVLDVFRSAAPRPAASDLSARILRKVRAQSPSRRPFGVTFGIDVRWAGVCAAALVVVIMAASILDEGPLPSIVLPEPQRVTEPESVRARLLEREQAPASRGRKELAKTAPAPAAPKPNDLAAKQAPLAAPHEETAAAPSSAAAFAPEPSASAETRLQAAAPADALAKRDEEKSAGRRDEIAQNKKEQPDAGAANEASGRDALKTERRSGAPAAGFIAPPARRITVPSDAPGGEAGMALDLEADAALHLGVRPVDGFGSPPALEPGADAAALAPLRGREFVLIVESAGRVRSASVSAGSNALNIRTKDKAAVVRDDLSPLLSLRFAPGDRPRRLVVRID